MAETDEVVTTLICLYVKDVNIVSPLDTKFWLREKSWYFITIYITNNFDLPVSCSSQQDQNNNN